MRVGFYGADEGMTDAQFAAFESVFAQLPVEVVHIAGSDDRANTWLEDRYPVVRHTGWRRQVLHDVVAACVTFVCPTGWPYSSDRVGYAHALRRLTVEVRKDGSTLWSRGEFA